MQRRRRGGGGEIAGRGLDHASLQEASVPGGRRGGARVVSGSVSGSFRDVGVDAEPDEIERGGHRGRRERELGVEPRGLGEVGVPSGEVLEERRRGGERPTSSLRGGNAWGWSVFPRRRLILFLCPVVGILFRESTAPSPRELVVIIVIRRPQTRLTDVPYVLLPVPARHHAQVPRGRVTEREQVPGPLRRDEPSRAHAARLGGRDRRARLRGRVYGR